MRGTQSHIKFTKKQVIELKDVCWMGRLWADSLVDAEVQNGKSDLKQARKVLRLLTKKLS